MYTAPSPEKGEDQVLPVPKDLTVQMAQRLYEHFSSMQLNADQWLECLEAFLVEAEGKKRKGYSSKDIKAKIRAIITGDKAIPLDYISEDARKAVYREVAEWLVAEKICEKMVSYESEIQEGLKSGKYKKFQQVHALSLLMDNDAFYENRSVEQIGDFIRDNYVINIGGRPLGAGARVEVRELMPVKFPLPYPEKDELSDGLMIKIPNRFLVLRLTKSSYKSVLGQSIDTREEEAIEVFRLASELLVFSGTERTVEDVSATTLEAVDGVMDQDIQPEKAPVAKKTVRRKKQYSFIPPLIIIKAQVEPGHPPEYMTIQKKVQTRGHIIRDDHNLIKDLTAIRGFRQKLRKFIEACKRFYIASGRLPDSVGHGNVLYTGKGNVYMVDINNINKEPKYKLIALAVLCRTLRNRLDDNLDEETRSTLERELRQAHAEMMNEAAMVERMESFDISKMDEVLSNLFVNNGHQSVKEFFSAAGLVDDLNLPIFMHNVQNLFHIEKNILESELKSGKITEEEFNKKIEGMQEEPMYRVHNSMRGVWKNKREFCLNDILENKRQGHDNWIAMYVGSIYSFLAHSDGG